MDTVPDQTKTGTKKPVSTLTLWCIALVCILPVVASTLIWWKGWAPPPKLQAGILIQPVSQVADCFSTSGSSHSDSWPQEFRHKWVLLVLNPTSPEDFREHLTQQLRTMQGKERDRIMRLTLFTQPSFSLPSTKDHIVLKSQWCKRAFSPAVENIPEQHRIYVIDPNGNMVMVFDARANPRAVHKDLTKLLLVSKIG